LLNSEAVRTTRGGGYAENVVDLAQTLMECNERGKAGRDDDRFWRDMFATVVRNAAELCLRAVGAVSFDYLYKVVTTAPFSVATAASAEFHKKSICCQCIKDAREATAGTSHARDIDYAADFFLNVWPMLADKTRSSVASIVTAAFDPSVDGDGVHHATLRQALLQSWQLPLLHRAPRRNFHTAGLDDFNALVFLQVHHQLLLHCTLH
jgi:hypothetical protein